MEEAVLGREEGPIWGESGQMGPRSHWGWPMMWVCLPQCQGVDATQGAIFLPGRVEGGFSAVSN